MNAGLLSILPLIITQLFNVSSPDYVASTLHATSIVYGIGGLAVGIMVGLLLNQFQSKKLIILFYFLASLALFYSTSNIIRSMILLIVMKNKVRFCLIIWGYFNFA